MNLMSKSPAIQGLGVYNTVVSEDSFYQMLLELVNERDSLSTKSVPLIVTKGLSNKCEIFYDGFKNPKYAPCPLLVNMVRAGKLGSKSGEGFYDYSESKKAEKIAKQFIS